MTMRKPVRSDGRPLAQECSEEEAGRQRDAADTTKTTTEAHPDHLAALQKSFSGTLNSESLWEFSQAL